MQFIQTNTIRALGDELRRQAGVSATVADGERAGPLSRLRHRTGHVLMDLGQTIAHGGHGVAHIARGERTTD